LDGTFSVEVESGATAQAARYGSSWNPVEFIGKFPWDLTGTLGIMMMIFLMMIY
jgi:hypothetical protein